MDNIIKPSAVNNISPHNQGLYEAGKKMLKDSTKVGRKFCQTMVEYSIGAIPIYLGFLTYITRNKQFTILGLILVSIPPILFIISSIIFLFGFLPKTEEFSLDMIDDFREQMNHTIRSREISIKFGFSIFVIGVLFVLFDIIMIIGF
jgi:hypothetical protein